MFNFTSFLAVGSFMELLLAIELPLESSLFRIGAAVAVLIILLLVLDLALTHRRRLLRRHKEAERQYQDFINGARDVVCVVSPNRKILVLNPAFETITGWSRTEWTGKTFASLIHPEDLATVSDALQRALQDSSPPICEARLCAKVGGYVLAEVAMQPKIEYGKIAAVVVTARDVTERRWAEEMIRQNNERFRSLVQNSSDLLSIISADGRIRYVSPSIERMIGLPSEDRSRANFLDIIHTEDAQRVRQAIRDTAMNAGTSPPVEFRYKHRDGSWRHIEAIATNLLDDPSVGGIVINARDISERKQFQEQLSRQAFYDPLTGLPNRALYMDRLRHALARAERTGERIAVLFMDLDRFKSINDSLGHGAGDALLIGFGQRLTPCLRPEDTLARLGGDEFTVLMEHITDNAGPARLAQRIIDQMKTPFKLEGRETVISTSIGIALSTSSVTKPDSILREADTALYAAKSAGKDRFMFFNPSMNTETSGSGISAAKLEMEGDLRRALEKDEFRLFYQPKIDLTSGRIVGVEALARWQHPERGLILPGEFLPVAEETSTIFDIDHWVMGEACQQVQAWGKQFPSLPPLRVSVNINAREFHDPSLIERIADVLDKTSMSPSLLELEGTEKILASNSPTTIRTIETLRRLGIGLALDDFGAGNTSLGPLRHLPVTTLKIDRSFVHEISNDERIRPILEAMTTMSHALGAQVVAEGIETSEQLAHMRKMHCDFGQGYYFAKPVPAEGIASLLGGDRPQPTTIGPVLQAPPPHANGHNGKH